MISAIVISSLLVLVGWLIYNNKVYHARQTNFYKQLWYRELSINCKLWAELNNYKEDLDLDFD